LFQEETLNASDPRARVFIKLRADIEWLCSRHLVERTTKTGGGGGDGGGGTVFQSTELGTIACRSYIEPETAALFKAKIVDSAMPLDLERLLRVLATSVEFRSMNLRRDDKKPLNAILKTTGRFCVKKNKSKAICRTTQDKVFQLFEHIFGNFEPFSKWNLNKDRQTGTWWWLVVVDCCC